MIAGPTASGKSALALAIAEHGGGRILNADALQVYECFRVLTARPDADELARAPHALYGHVSAGTDYSVGAWLRDVAPLLDDLRPIIVGGTGLYFRALTEGLAEIPEVPAEVRQEADGMTHAALLAELDRHDPELSARIDRVNRARVQRGWEVWRATGRALSLWQAETAPPLLPVARATPILLEAEPEEVRSVLPDWERLGGARKAIGAPELAAHLRGDIDLATATERAIIASRQYAKRQRTWFRARMGRWQSILVPATG